MSEMGRDRLLAVVREAYAGRDPAPADLVARMQAATALAADQGGGLDVELMLLLASERSGELAGARGGLAYTLRMAHGDTELLLRVAPESDGGADVGGREGPSTARLDGWMVPPEPMTVRALVDGAPATASAVAAVVSEAGRFELAGLPAGLIRLRFEPHDVMRAPFLTPAFEI